MLFGFNVVDADAARGADRRAAGRAADVLIGIDEEGGDVTRLGHRDGSPYPGNAALGAIDDPELTGADLPVDRAETWPRSASTSTWRRRVDVNTVSDNPIIGTRSFGADPARVAAHRAAAVTGLQAAGVAACAKHFPGHGATNADSHLELPIVDVTTGRAPRARPAAVRRPRSRPARGRS